uniref:Uncharacterized protein n=1 Tax=Leersia perrieri TaxID=77586 RepID=A0A0D9VE00_9ORYZ
MEQPNRPIGSPSIPFPTCAAALLLHDRARPFRFPAAPASIPFPRGFLPIHFHLRADPSPAILGRSVRAAPPARPLRLRSLSYGNFAQNR